jgi:hypothetical protein
MKNKLLIIIFLGLIFACKQNTPIAEPASDKLKQSIDSGCFELDKQVLRKAEAERLNHELITDNLYKNGGENKK